MLIDAYIPAGSGEILDNYAPLLRAGNVKNKALLPLNGRPMITYVIEALNESKYVRSITIAGLNKNEIEIKVDKPITFIEGGKTSFNTLDKAIDHFNNMENPPEYLLSISSDIPCVTGEMIDKIISSIDFTQNVELYYNVVWYNSVAKLYPEVKKVPFKLKEGKLVFGDIHVFRANVLKKGDRRARVNLIMQNRKKFSTVIKLFSFKYFIKYIFKRLTLREAALRTSEIFDVNLAFILVNFPETCIDLDYKRDYEHFKNYCKKQKRKLGDNDRVQILTREKLEKGVEIMFE